MAARRTECRPEKPNTPQCRDAALSDSEQITIRWCKGHAGIVGNERADELSLVGRQRLLDVKNALPHSAGDLDAQYRSIMAR
nr:RNase H family protein [Ensifer sp. Root423]